jgi:hypothetical protein
MRGSEAKAPGGVAVPSNGEIGESTARARSAEQGSEEVAMADRPSHASIERAATGAFPNAYPVDVLAGVPLRSYVVVIDRMARSVIRVVEGPSLRDVTALRKGTPALKARAQELSLTYRPPVFDVAVVHSERRALRGQLPLVAGWDDVVIEPLDADSYVAAARA